MKPHLVLILAAALLLSACSSSHKTRSPFVEVSGDTLKVSTVVLGKDVKGFRGPVPMVVSVTGGRISDIKILDNNETPRFLNKAADGLLPKWIGLTVKQASRLEVDAVSGATWSSNAIKENMCLALKELSK